MTRQHGGDGRYTPPGTVSTVAEDDHIAPLRKRSPVTYWVAILLVVLLVLSLSATVLTVLFG